MKTIGPNYITLGLRITLLCFFGYLLGIIVKNFNAGKYDDLHPVVYFGMVVFFVIPFYVVRSMVCIFRIQYSDTAETISLWKIPTGEIRMSIDDVVGYYSSSFSTKANDYQVYFLKLSDGRHIELTGYNLRRLPTFHSFLVEHNVPYLGRKTNWFPFNFK